MDMRKLAIVAAAGLGLAACAGAPQVEYVTRGSLGGHAIRFGSSPLRATMPRAYVRVNNAPHATGGAARPLDVRMPIRLIRIHGSDHVIPAVAVRQSAPRTEAPRPEPVVEAGPRRPEPPAPSRHALMVNAILKNKLDCHP